MIMYFLKGFIVGLAFGIPVGAIGALTIQRTLLYGRKSGILTGLGSSVADCIYAACGAFGISIINEFLAEHQRAIHIMGRILILLLGISILKKRMSYGEIVEKKEKKENKDIQNFLSSFMIGITNPVAIATFLIAFSYLEIDGNLDLLPGSMLISGVFIGTLCWWILLATCVDVLKERIHEKHFTSITRTLGCILIILAIFMR